MAGPTHRFLAYGDRAVHENAPKVLEDRATTSRVAQVTDEADALKCPRGQHPVRDPANFVPQIRSILKARGWEVAAWFQTVWVNTYANQLKGQAKDGEGTAGPLKIVDVNMDWVLGFKRARKVFDEITKPSVFANEKARTVLKAKIERNFQEQGGEIVRLGNLAAVGRALDDEYINFRVFGSYRDLSDYKLDELTAALGRFTMYVVPGGAAERRDSQVHVTISKVGVYLRDSFDFNGEQSLGFWRKPDDISIGAPDTEMGRAGRYPRCSGDWFEMSNAAYRRYRDRTGYGHDFLVYSDLKLVDLGEPVVFAY